MAVLKFTKMHGLGNDFMVIDGISQHFDPAAAPIAEWADRHRGIGFDQLLLGEAPPLPEAECGYRIFSAATARAVLPVLGTKKACAETDASRWPRPKG